MTQKQSSLAEPLGRRPKGLKSREKQFKHVFDFAFGLALATHPDGKHKQSACISV